MNPVWSFLGKAFEPFTKMVDEIHTSDEERGQIKAAMFQVQAQVTEKVLAYESQLLESKTQIIAAEANGKSWMQRNWRPITMLTFLVLVCLDSFGLLAFRLSTDAWDLLKLGLGGYVVGRSVEKVAPSITKAMSK